MTADRLHFSRDGMSTSYSSSLHGIGREFMYAVETLYKAALLQPHVPRGKQLLFESACPSKLVQLLVLAGRCIRNRGGV